MDTGYGIRRILLFEEVNIVRDERKKREKGLKRTSEIAISVYIKQITSANRFFYYHVIYDL